MKYCALVADDESIIRRGIIGFLKKHTDIEVVGEAEDGEIALEIAQKMTLDILFVDINMPFLNGLEFIEEVKKLQPGAVVVVITGYDNFEYARQALRLGVDEYILKPLMVEAFDQAVEKILLRMRNKREEENYLNWAKGMLQENKQHLRQEFLNRWVEGHLCKEEILEKMEYLKMQIPQPYVLTLIHLEHNEVEDTADKWNEDLIFYAAKNIACEVYGSLEPVYSGKDSYGNLYLIHDRIDGETIGSLTDTCVKNIERYTPSKVVILSKEGKGVEELGGIYAQLLEEMDTLSECSGVIKAAKAVIEQRYGQEDFSLLDVARECCLSPQHMSRLFRKEMGITFVDYLTRVRTRKALELLAQLDLKMYEIAEHVGYASQHYFSNVFKKEMGMSPAEYRKSLRE